MLDSRYSLFLPLIPLLLVDALQVGVFNKENGVWRDETVELKNPTPQGLLEVIAVWRKPSHRAEHLATHVQEVGLVMSKPLVQKVQKPKESHDWSTITNMNEKIKSRNFEYRVVETG